MEKVNEQQDVSEKMKDVEREAFEAWAASVGYNTDRDMFQREKYQSTLTWELWRVWQARACLPAGYMPIPTAEQLAEALENVGSFHDMSAELIAPELLANLLESTAKDCLVVGSGLPVGVPDGWKLVPVALTEKMYAKCHLATRVTAQVWSDLLAAAPAAPTVKAEQVQCDTCHGQGEICVGQQTFGYMSMQPPEPIMEVCPECGGEEAPSLPAAGSAVEEVEVVGWLGGNGLHAEENMASGAPFPLMTVAQHERIVAALSQQAEPAPAQDEREYPHEAMDKLAIERYRVGAAGVGTLHRFAVQAGDGEQELYRGRESDCQNVARKLAGAFLDGGLALWNMIATRPAQTEQQPVAEVLWPDEPGRRGGFSQIGHYDDPRLPVGAKLYAAPIAQTAQQPERVSVPVELLRRVCREDGASNDMAMEELRTLLANHAKTGKSDQ